SGAARLLPLTPAQIQGYLGSQDQGGLWEEISADNDLLDFTRTPLILHWLSLVVRHARKRIDLDTRQLNTSTFFDWIIKRRFESVTKTRYFFDEDTMRTMLGKLG